MTLEAHLFMKKFRRLSLHHKYIDKHLIHALYGIITVIEKFLDRNNEEIVDTEKSRLAWRAEMVGIERNYRCSRCKIDFRQSTERAAEHVTSPGHIKKMGSKCEIQSESPIMSPTNYDLAKCSKETTKHVARQDQIQQLSNHPSLNIEDLLNKDLIKFIADQLLIADELKSIPEYEVIESQLFDLVKPLFPKQTLRVYRIGSRITGIGERDSNFDIFLDIGDTFEVFENQPSPYIMNKFKKVSKAMRMVPYIWKIEGKVERALVPVIKAYNFSARIKCEISFSNSLAVINTKLIEHFFDIQPIARHICLFLKNWWRCARLTPCYPTYSMVLMVTYFLQIKEILPSVEFLQKSIDLKKAIFIGPWLATFGFCALSDVNKDKVSVTATSIQMYLRLFFEFYSQFDFEAYAVCPYLGKLLKIEDLEKEMPTRWNTLNHTIIIK
ncbi:terminal uridylyltransferase Tailor-like [Glossina fuscipes]|uniref:Terminal uridylyltransferase Tailor-like n=1 Tax=Glossina fuscipes TaxID=7396 RepID=A0A9C6E3G6_9MUSC|nr:terminal uridylyltransferase Tailor-like [Glossina fuscipes]